MSNKLTFNFNSEQFKDFLSKLKDLSTIDENIKIKIDNDNIFMYSMISNDIAVLALKSYQLDTQSYINYQEDFITDYVILNAKKFVKSLNILNSEQKIKMDLVYKISTESNSIAHVRSGLFTSGKMKISCVGGEQFKIRDITKVVLNNRLDPNNSLWNFNVKKEDFESIKKLSTINNDDKVIDINSNSGVVKFGEYSKWELEVDDESTGNNEKVIFLKKFLSNIDATQENIRFDVFDTFILVKDEISNLMLSFEQNFE